jgi:hypothetical protein
MDERPEPDAGRIALAIGAVAIGSATCLATYFAVGGPFGTINDIGNGAIGVLSGVLAWRLRGTRRSALETAALGAAVAGAAVTVVGSTLVVSGTTGFLLAGLVSSLGFAGIGSWLAVASREGGAAAALHGPSRRFGVVAGALMATGVLSIPGILNGFDDLSTAPGWVWAGFLSWLGIYVAYPAWAIRAGAHASRGRSRLAGPTPAAVRK